MPGRWGAVLLVITDYNHSFQKAFSVAGLSFYVFSKTV